MEQRVGFVKSKERGLVAHRGGEVTNVDDDRSYPLTVFGILAPEGAHPCSGPFRFTGEVVYVENADQCAVGFRHFVYLYLGVIDGYVFQPLELEAIQFIGHIKRASPDTFWAEIRLQFGLA